MKKLTFILFAWSLAMFSCKSDQEKAQDLFEQAQVTDSTKNFEESIKLYEESAQLGKIESYLRLGDIYRDTIAGVTDTVKAIGYYQKADSLGLLEAASELGALYFHGYGTVKSDTAKAVKLIEKAGSKATGNGNYTLAMYYEKGDKHADEKKSKEYAEKAVKQGQPRAYGFLGWIYEDAKDYKKALELILRGVELKAPNSICQYGIILTNSEHSADYGVEPDGKKGIELLKSVVKEYPYAAVNIGYTYACGNGVEKDESKAAYWYKISADANDPMGLYDYGISLYNGQGTNQDKRLGLKYIKRSAALGCKLAKEALNNPWYWQ